MKPDSRRPDRPVSSLALVAGTVVVTVLTFGSPIASSAQTRDWTSGNGDSLKAAFVKMDGDRVVLKKEDGELVAISKNDLSDSDREIIKIAMSISGSGSGGTADVSTKSRMWRSSDGFTMEGSLLRLEGSAAVIKSTDGELISVPLDKLSAADREYAFESRAGAVSSGRRTWSSSDGFGIDATFEELRGDRVVLRTTDDNLVTIEFTKLSAADQKLAQSLAAAANPDTGKSRLLQWESNSGFKIRASFVKFDGDIVVLKDEKGEYLQVTKSELNPASQALLPKSDPGLFPPQ